MSRSLRRWTLLMLLVGTCACSGCLGPLATLMYVVYGPGDIKAEYTGLKGKRIAVVCQSTTQLSINDVQVPKEIAQRVAADLKEKASKVTVISRREVEKYIDDTGNEDYVAVGKGVKADMVVAIDLDLFRTYAGKTVYRGQAECTIAVYDLNKDGGEKVWERRMPKILFPPNTEVSSTAMTERDFRNLFVKRLGELIGRNFYDYPMTEDFAGNANFE